MLARTKFTQLFIFGFFCLVFGFVPRALGTSYTTNFQWTENPISEKGRWINGRMVGLDWANVRTTTGLAFGTETDTVQHDDSIAILGGTWGADQIASATVHTVNQTSSMFEEVELRLRTSITAHSITGYEISFRCTADGSQYVQIVRSNGTLGSFTLLDSRTGPGLHDGDVVKASISGSMITAYINNSAILSATDSIFTSGSPGMGFHIQGGSASQEADYGFTMYAAMDGSTTRATSDASSSLIPSNSSSVSGSSSSGQTYTTNFPLTENPISEGGKWIDGKTVGLDWTDVQSTPGLAFTTEAVNSPNLDDSTALLTGTWGPNQTVQAVVHRVGIPHGEVEIRLHSSLSAHSCTGYELTFAPGYVGIVRWNGPLNNFTPLTFDSTHGVKDGDTVKGTITSSGVITLYINGTQISQATDTTYSGGAPGIGMYNSNNGDPVFSDFGFTTVTATDSSTGSQKPNPPTGLNATVN